MNESITDNPSINDGAYHEDVHNADAVQGTRVSVRDQFFKGLWFQNPVLVHTLGVCPALAMTRTMAEAVAMALATALVLIASEISMFYIQKHIPKTIQLPGYLIVIAMWVTLVDLGLQAWAPLIALNLGIFIPLIAANGMIVYAALNSPESRPLGDTIVQSMGLATGFSAVLICLATIREILGNGTWFSLSLFGSDFQPMQLFAFPAGAFIVLGFLIAGYHHIRRLR